MEGKTGFLHHECRRDCLCEDVTVGCSSFARAWSKRRWLVVYRYSGMGEVRRHVNQCVARSGVSYCVRIDSMTNREYSR